MAVYHDKTDFYNALQHYFCTPSKILNGECFVFVKDKWITLKEYKKHNSKPSYEPIQPNNEDKTKIPNSVKIRKYR